MPSPSPPTSAEQILLDSCAYIYSSDTNVVTVHILVPIFQKEDFFFPRFRSGKMHVGCEKNSIDYISPSTYSILHNILNVRRVDLIYVKGEELLAIFCSDRNISFGVHISLKLPAPISSNAHMKHETCNPKIRRVDVGR